MTTPVRVPGLRGRKPAKRLALQYIHDYATSPLPAPAYPVDVTGGIGDQAWGMLGNGPDPTCTTHPDGVGDCGFAAREHNKYAKAAVYKETETRETSDQLVAEYLAYDGGQDDGVVLADVLLAWYKAGKIKAFAPVDHADPAAVDSAMQEFKGVIAGVNLTDDAENLFAQGQPWTVAGGEQPDPSEGHAIVKVKADGHALDGYVTWGGLIRATREWSAACVVECWVAVTSEDEAAKVDMPRLLGDINALGGTGGVPEPAPVPPAPPHPAPPAPQPSPPPKPDPATLLSELVQMIRADASNIQNWLRYHGLLGDVMSKLSVYSKAFTAVIGQALTYATLYYGGNKYVAAAVAVAAALGVYAVPNQQPPSKSGPAGS